MESIVVFAISFAGLILIGAGAKIATVGIRAVYASSKPEMLLGTRTGILLLTCGFIAIALGVYIGISLAIL